MYTLKNEGIFKMSKDNPPALRVPDKSTVEFETLDCFSNQLKEESRQIDTLDWNRINPATGPVYVEGAEIGDALKISILSIELPEWGTMVAIPDNGVLGSLIPESQIKRLPIKNGLVQFSPSIFLPVSPMIGVIGVAPESGEIFCGEPGNHGGNMDTTRIAPGAVLYLPVYHRGALLALGDVHAVMGDGEIMVSGVEVPARVTVTLEVVKNAGVKLPLLEDRSVCAAIASDEDVERAVFEATAAMAAILMKKRGLSFNEAGMLLSAAGKLCFCQIVDPKRTVRMEVPKTILSGLI
ncbi:MAG: acetamidase/formamidase family protein [Spirochaetaceae bacterium]|jgi:amidase|nr:acetamidase/formamidase family protein [Spirochaetaceae bacterium]